MQFTIEARLLVQALKSINIRRAMEDVVQLQVHAGTLILTTRTLSFSEWGQEERLLMHASYFLTEGVTVRKQGEIAVSYRRLADSLKAFDGTIAVQQVANELLIAREGTSAQKQYAIVPTLAEAEHFTTTPIEVGTTYKSSSFCCCIWSESFQRSRLLVCSVYPRQG